MSNTLKIRNTRGEIVTTVNETSTSTDLSLILHGRGKKKYGLGRDENLVHLLENFSNTTPPLNAIEGQLWWDRAIPALFVLDPTIGSPSWTSVVPPPADIGFDIIAGIGLTGGGRPTGSPLTTTIDVAEGTGITVTADAVSTNDSEIDHDNLFEAQGGGQIGFANEHIDHSTVSLIAGDGFIATGGGDLTASRILNVGAGTGILSTADDVRVDSTVVRTTGNVTIGGAKQWRAPLRGDIGSSGTPGWSFAGDTNTGFYRSAENQLSFTTGGTHRFRVESNGVLHSLNNSYETLVTQNDDIPNKKYVDDKPVSSTFPTENIHIGVSTIVGVIAGKKYLVTVYGVQKHRGLGWATLGKIRVGSGTNPGFGTELASIPSVNKEWIHGQAPVMGSVVVTPTTVQLNATVDHISSADNVSARRMIAIQLD